VAIAYWPVIVIASVTVCGLDGSDALFVNSYCFSLTGPVEIGV